MSILDKASLIQIPSGYKSTKLYSLRPINGDGDFTFARSSSATRVNSEGLIEVPSVLGTTEEVTNGDFATDTAWNKNANWSISGGVAIADGTTSNDLNQGTTNAVIGKKYFISFDVVSLSQGTFFAKIGGVGVVGNEVGSFSATVTATSTDRLRIIAQSNAIGTIDNVSVIQYIENDVPRLDYSGGASCASLLLEPQRTNLITYSESFDNAYWTKSQVTITSNDTTSPDGTQNSDKVVETTNNSEHIFYRTAISTLGTISIYAKADNSGRLFQIRRDAGTGTNSWAWFNLDNGTVESEDAGVASIESLSNNWYRCIFTPTNASGTIVFSISNGATTRSVSYQGDGTSGVYIYGAQVEAGSYPTSYIISNSGSQTTRSADVCNNAGTSATFNSTEGVLFAEIAALAENGGNRGIAISDGTSSNRVLIYYTTTTNQITALYTYNGTTQVSINKTFTDSTQFSKCAFKYKENDCAFWIDGVEVGADNTATAFAADTLDTLNFDSGAGGSDFYGKTKQLMFFNEALSDEELADLTGAVHQTFNSLATFYGYTIL